MGTDAAKCKSTLGFLTVVERSQYGLIGGYLVLNPAGRPLEFHCTVPIKANRAQEILYGPTLRPYLFGEQVGQTLLIQSHLEPLAVLTDCEDMLAVREFVATPVALVIPSIEVSGRPTLSPEQDPPAQPRAPRPSRPATIDFSLGTNRLAVPVAWEADQDAIVQRLTPLGLSMDLSEPFGRIREAIDEAQKAA